MFTPYRIAFLVVTKGYPICNSPLNLHSVTEIAPKSRFLCVNRSPIRYGFRAGAKAIQYSVSIALVYDSDLIESKC